MGNGKLACRSRAAELVGDHGLPRLRCLDRKAAQGMGMAQGFKKQHVAVDIGIAEGGFANLPEGEIDLVADRYERGKPRAPRIAAG